MEQLAAGLSQHVLPVEKGGRMSEKQRSCVECKDSGMHCGGVQMQASCLLVRLFVAPSHAAWRVVWELN